LTTFYFWNKNYFRKSNQNVNCFSSCSATLEKASETQTRQKNPQLWPLEEPHIIQQIFAVLERRKKRTRCQALTLAASCPVQSKANNLPLTALSVEPGTTV